MHELSKFSVQSNEGVLVPVCVVVMVDDVIVSVMVVFVNVNEYVVNVTVPVQVAVIVILDTVLVSVRLVFVTVGHPLPSCIQHHCNFHPDQAVVNVSKSRSQLNVTGGLDVEVVVCEDVVVLQVVVLDEVVVGLDVVTVDDVMLVVLVVVDVVDVDVECVVVVVLVVVVCAQH